MAEEGRMPDPRPDADPTRALDPAERVPNRIGNYRIVQKIGQGGMGEVYEARQERPVRRVVALKIVKPGMDSKQIVARFEWERQALALMNHPNIAGVLDAGTTESGRPYFVMELVRGKRITKYCDENRMSPQARLELFLDVCDGMQHAHQKGIIHRDVKPSNILVTIADGKPVPKIIDFGVAKATQQRLTEETLYTMVGQMIGTPAYMSPEQADVSGLDVDVRSDIYSLGVLLYELLVGALPFDSEMLRTAPLDEVRRRIREDDPPRPSTRISSMGEASTDSAGKRRTSPPQLVKLLRGDLDWITMKALEKDRTRRYPSAAELAADVRRHLSDEPVLASPPSATYRIGKFVRRHRAGVAFAVVLLVLLTGFAVTMSLQATRIARERNRANEEAARASQEAETARRTRDFLVGLFRAANPEKTKGETITARELLDRGAEQVTSELEEQPLVRAEIMKEIGEIYRILGVYDSAIPLLEESLALMEKHLEDDDPVLGRHLTQLATLYWTLGRYDEAEPLYVRALELAERGFGPEDMQVAAALNNLGYHYESVGQFERAKPLYLRSLAIREKALGPEHPRVALALGNLAILYQNLDEADKAEEAYRRALTIEEKVLEPDDPNRGHAMHNLANVRRRQGAYEEAEALLRRALALWEKAYGPEHRLVAAARVSTGHLYVATDRLAEAEKEYERAIAILEKALGPRHAETAEALQALAELRVRQGRASEAESLCRDVLSIREDVFGAENSELVSPLLNLANLCREQGRASEAEPLYRRALAIAEARLGPEHSRTVGVRGDYAAFLSKTGRAEDAARLSTR